MKTVRDIFSAALAYIANKPLCRKRDLETLFASVIFSSAATQRLNLYMNFDRPLQENEIDKLRAGVKRLVTGEPVEYILGKVQFCDCEIFVDKRVLIPRVETEELVHKIVNDLGPHAQGTLLDLCTGSGCIGIAIKKKCPGVHVILSDIDCTAIEVARHNSQVNGCDVTLLQGDLLDPLTHPVDFLVCNPPYIAEHEYHALAAPLRFEPKRALLAGPTGTEFYDRLAPLLHRYVLKKFWFELSSTTTPAPIPYFSNAIIHDSYGKQRFLVGEKQIIPN